MLALESKNSVMAKSGGEEEIELELGLAIGTTYRKSKNCDRSQPDSNGSVSSCNTTRTTGESQSFFLGLNPRLSKSEIHALRRQEAKKKREARLVKRGLLCSKGKDRDFDIEHQPESKKPKTEGKDQVKNVTPSLSLAVQYPYPPQQTLRYGPLNNGFMHPCANGNVLMMPSWVSGGAGNKERNVIQPVARYCTGPLQVLSDSGYNMGNGYDSEHNGSRDGGNIKAGISNGSSMCTSSAGSDYRSTSHEGGGSCDTRSHSSHSIPDMKHSKPPEVANGLSGHGATSHLEEPAASLNEQSNHPEKTISSHTAQSSPVRPKEEPKSASEKITEPSDKDISSREISPSKECNGSSKPPKPQIQHQNSTPLPYMPCVSTTGNGPNGKTINGFLYRYTKAEVSIICVCHGTSFSPAEFVQHAGGTDVSHPLRHITVVPSVI